MLNIKKYWSFSIGHWTLGGGFTLIELMIVIVIVGILTLIGASSFWTAQAKGRDTKRKGDIHGIATAVEAYNSDKGKYPDDDGNGNIMGCGVGDSQPCPWGGRFSDSKGTVYMALLPKDPTTGRQYYYRVTGSAYQLYARLENTGDAAVPHGASGQPQAYSNTSCGNVLCNTGISSNIKLTTGSDLIDEVTVTPTPTPTGGEPTPTLTPACAPLVCDPLPSGCVYFGGDECNCGQVGCADPPPGCGGEDCVTPTPTPPPVNQFACVTDNDCGCGISTITSQCEIANTNYLSEYCMIPDFCTGITGNCFPKCTSGSCNLYCPGQPTATPTPTGQLKPPPTGGPGPPQQLTPTP